MLENTFDSLVLEVHYLNLDEVQLTNKNECSDRVLLYFCRSIDSPTPPLSVTKGQANQLYRDLKKLFTD